MRERKYRIWDVKNQKMLEDDFLRKSHGSSHLSITLDGSVKEDFSCCCNNETDYHGEERFIIIEWTGLQDKTGLDIYEGDIVKDIHCNGWVSAIAFTDVGFCVAQDHPAERGLFELGIDQRLEVVGNIFENPELLEEG